MRSFDETETKGRIANLDLEPIKFKLVKEFGYDVKDVEEIEMWYRRFLFLTFKHRGESIVVNRDIDTFWHQHILDTRKYADDCSFVFGEFLHHFPYFGLRGDDDERALNEQYRRTSKLMQSEFGAAPPASAKRRDNASDGNLPSSCSDCGGNIGPASPHMLQRPSLSVSRHG